MDISGFSSEDDQDNNHNVIIETKTKEKTTHSKQDKVTADTAGANVTATKASILQRTEKRRVKARENK